MENDRFADQISDYNADYHRKRLQEYQQLDDFTAKIDQMICELERMRQEVQLMMSNLDHLYLCYEVNND